MRNISSMFSEYRLTKTISFVKKNENEEIYYFTFQRYPWGFFWKVEGRLTYK
jgi:hypothetical protein